METYCPQDAGVSKPGSANALFQQQIEGRFRKITVRQLCMVWWLHQSGKLTRRQLRVYFAVHEMAERRRYAKPNQAAGQKVPARVRYGLEELKKLVGGRGTTRADADLQGDLRALARIGLVRMSEHAVAFAREAEELTVENTDGFQTMLDAMPHSRRSVPVPRRTLRALAAGFSRGTTAVMIALLIRSLFWHRDRSDYRTDGRTKLAWISKVFRISRRAATEAHSHLVKLGWLEPQKVAHWERNRWGLRDRINPDWKPGDDRSEPVDSSTSESANYNGESASRYGQPHGESASPELTSTSPYGESLKPRRPGESPRSRSGVSKKLDEQKGREAKATPAPRFHDIKFVDLRSTDRLLELYKQASAQGLVADSEANRLEFTAMAERALARGKSPPAMFAWLVKSWKTAFITQSDEDAARRRLTQHDHDLREGQGVEILVAPARPKFTETELFVEKCILVAKQCGNIDPFHVANRLEGWEREKWKLQHSAYEIKDRRHWLQVGEYLEGEAQAC